MKKFSKIGKRVLAFFLVALMNINTYATTTANDGSSFVTKAEFDDMMYDFNIKMNEYQSALNAKIDASISSYLAGMSAQSVIDLENYAKMAKEDDVNNTKFTQWKTPSPTKNVHDVYAAFYAAAAYGNGIGNNEERAPSMYGNSILSNQAAWAGGPNEVKYTDYTGVLDNFKSAYYFVKFPYFNDGNTDDFYMQTESNNIIRKELQFRLYAMETQFRSAVFSDKTWETMVVSPATSYTVNLSNFRQPSGEIKYIGEFGFLTRMQPYCIQTHAWYNFDATTDRAQNSFLNYNLSGTVSGNDYGINYDLRDYYDTSNQVTLEIQSARPAATTIGSNSGSAMSALIGTEQVNAKRGVSVYSNNVSFKFQYNRPVFYDLNWTKLTNNFFNNILGTSVYKYQGMPITKTNREGTIKFTLTLNNPSTGTYVYAISDKPFENGAIPEHMYETVGGKQYDHILLRGAVSRSGDEVIDVSLDKAKVYDTIKGDVLWLKVEPSVAGEVVSATVSNNIREYLNN